MDGDGQQNKKKLRLSIGYLILGLWVVLLLQQVLAAYMRPNRMPYSEFKAAVTSGKVEEVAIGQTLIQDRTKPDAPPADSAKPEKPTQDTRGSLKDRNTFETVRVDDPELIKDLGKYGVKVNGVVESNFWREAAGWIIPIAIIGVFWMLMIRRAGQAGHNGFMTIGRSKAKVYMEKDVNVRFTDVAGVDEAKEELKEIIEFLKTPARFARLGATLPKGVMLVGPPGTGKTLLARAVAGEAHVPFFSLSGSEFVEMFVGVGAARIRDLFAQAEAKAPCIVFIDELDALGKVRVQSPLGSHEEREQTLNQLLAEMDGFDSKKGVIIMAATNRPEVLDPALLRPGRFDRQVLVDKPDVKGREAILRIHAKHVTLAVSVDFERIAVRTAGFSGADLANLVNEAALLAARRNKTAVERADFEEAIDRLVAGLEKK